MKRPQGGGLIIWTGGFLSHGESNFVDGGI